MTEKLKNQLERKPTKIKHKRGKFRINPFKLGPGSYYVTLEAFRVLNTFRSYLHGHFVDMGCGNVPYYEWYKDRVEKFTCMDWPINLHKSKHMNIFADLNQALPLAASSVDCILLSSVLEHISNPEMLFKEISRV